jgi:hypothetical protein
VTRYEETPMPPVLLNGQELARRLDHAYPTVMGWYRDGLIPGIKTGRCVVFNLDLVVRALRANVPATAGEDELEPAGVEAMGA